MVLKILAEYCFGIAAGQTEKMDGQDKDSQVIDWPSNYTRPMSNIPLVSDSKDGGYVRFELLQSFQSEGSSSIASTFGTSDSKQESSPDSSDDPIYEEVSNELILRIMPSGKILN